MAVQKTKLNIAGMSDDHSAETVLSTLGAVPGAKFAEVSVPEGSATVEYEDSEAGPQDFVEAVETAGYGASLG